MFGNFIEKMRAVRETHVVFAPLTRLLENRRLCASFALVLLVHVALIWLLESQLVPPLRLEGAEPDTQVALIAAAPPSQFKPDPVPEPRMQAAVTSEVAPPDIEIQDVTGAIGAISMATILPPRPDPAIRNVSPALPSAFAKMASQAEVLLTIMVNADGSIGEARLAKSCGVTLLDQLAQSFVKANWRFRAATVNGAASSDWTTVMVKFAPTV